MKPRWTSALATILLVLVISMLVIFVWSGLDSSIPSSDLVFTLMLIAFPMVGWLIAVRHPKNPLGWIFLFSVLFIAIGSASEEFALQAGYAGSEATAALLLIVGGWIQFPGYMLIIGPAILLFPDGRVPGKQFRWALWVLAMLMLVWGVVYAIGSEMLCMEPFAKASDPCVQLVENPLGVFTGAGLGEAADSLVLVIFVLTLGTSVTALLYRYRRSTGEVRQQIKWVAWMAVAGMLVEMALVVSEEVLGLIQSDWIEVLAFAPIMVGLPVAIAISILKYRLYDIDRIISRTAAYALIAVVLAAVYVVGVTLAQRILPVQGSSLGVVVSTLMVAALFNPLRSRVQNTVDRRFNRSRYDAQQVLAEFSTQLRADVDLEQMQAALLSAAQETMQPSHMSLWVRELESERR